MFEVLEENANYLFVRSRGRLVHADYEGLLPKLETLIRNHGRVRFLFEMVEFEGIELRAVWDEIRFDTRHLRDVERCAVIGNRAWEKWATKFAGVLFVGAQFRYFDADQVEEARAWVQAA